MENNIVYLSQLTAKSYGRLRVNATSILGSRPIAGATVRISYTGVPDNMLEEITTDIVGQTESINLPAPPLEYSMKPNQNQPYSEYTLEISAPGFESVEISGAEILPDATAIQNAAMIPLDDAVGEGSDLFVIPPHTLYGDYPPKIAEAEIKPTNETGEIVLSRVVIPEYIVVHDGPPTDASAKNYYVKYRDYIKNVASCEIYATWPDATIMANVLAIQSFTLNRVYTEWYRNKGYNFTITTSTAFDHKYIPGRNIFESIDRVVDTIFSNYLSRPGVAQPILTQYCDGNRVQCPNWMTGWQERMQDKPNCFPQDVRHGLRKAILKASSPNGTPP